VSEELKDKMDQALRKRRYLQSNPKILQNIIDKSDYPSAVAENIENFVALVVTNSFIFEGIQNQEPYFVHINTLFNLLLNGDAIWGDIKNGQQMEYLVSSRISNTPFEDTLLQDIKQPPKKEYYEKCTNLILNQIPRLDQDEPYGIYQRWAYQSPILGKVFEILKKCSFSDRIQTKAGKKI
jgi:hypothetical protein